MIVRTAFSMFLGLGILASVATAQSDPQATNWTLLRLSFEDGSTATPSDDEVYTLRFDKTGSVGGTIACNTCGAGSYSHQDKTINLVGMFCTNMYCGGSIESDYFTLIARPLTYTIAGPNLLVFSGEDTLVFGPDSVEDGLFSTTWTLEYVGSPGSQPESPPASETYSLNFDMDGPDVSGMVNCNNCFGQYDVAGEHIDIRLAMCTSKGCMSSVLQSSYSSLLAKASTFEIEGKRLFLFAESDTLVYTSSPNVVSLVESSPRSRMSIGRSLSASSAAVYDMRGRAVEASGSGSGYSVKLIVPKNGNAPKIILSK